MCSRLPRLAYVTPTTQEHLALREHRITGASFGLAYTKWAHQVKVKTTGTPIDKILHLPRKLKWDWESHDDAGYLTPELLLKFHWKWNLNPVSRMGFPCSSSERSEESWTYFSMSNNISTDFTHLTLHVCNCQYNYVPKIHQRTNLGHGW